MKSLALIVGLVAVAQAGALPEPTNAAENEFQMKGMSPRPTGHFDLFKRLTPDYTICGYVGGDPQYPLDCAAQGRSDSPCGFNDNLSWFGCCSTYANNGGTLSPVGCPRVTACVPSSKLSACTGACASDTLLRFCTNSNSPYCGAFIMLDTQSYANFFCASTPGAVYTVYPTTTGGAIGASTTRQTTGTNSPLFGGGGSNPTNTISTSQFLQTPSTTRNSGGNTAGGGTTVSPLSSAARATGGAMQTAAPFGLGLAGAAVMVLNVL